MLGIIGLILTFVCVFGIYIVHGGNMDVILHALPAELGTIGGAALGAFLLSHSGKVAKKTPKEMMKAFKGAKWKKKDYNDLLCLMFALCKLMKSKGLIALEAHIENPKDSAIFSQYPSILKDHFATDLICDTLRSLTMGMEDAMQVEDSIDKLLEKHHHEALAPGEALQNTADALPAIGIVAAVLGVVKTMASISEPVEVLGAMIGGALVGTFLGVFLAYTIVGPLATNNQAAHNQDHQFYLVIRDILVAHLKGMAPQVSVELGRGQVPTHLQATFAEMEEMTGDIKVE